MCEIGATPCEIVDKSPFECRDDDPTSADQSAPPSMCFFGHAQVLRVVEQHYLRDDLGVGAMHGKTLQVRGFTQPKRYLAIRVAL